jgi:hypothetical protein
VGLPLLSVAMNLTLACWVGNVGFGVSVCDLSVRDQLAGLPVELWLIRVEFDRFSRRSPLDLFDGSLCCKNSLGPRVLFLLCWANSFDSLL